MPTRSQPVLAGLRRCRPFILPAASGVSCFRALRRQLLPNLPQPSLLLQT